jgi:hypothetical protein
MRRQAPPPLVPRREFPSDLVPT